MTKPPVVYRFLSSKEISLTAVFFFGVIGEHFAGEPTTLTDHRRAREY